MTGKYKYQRKWENVRDVTAVRALIKQWRLEARYNIECFKRNDVISTEKTAIGAFAVILRRCAKELTKAIGD